MAIEQIELNNLKKSMEDNLIYELVDQIKKLGEEDIFGKIYLTMYKNILRLVFYVILINIKILLNQLINKFCHIILQKELKLMYHF